ncbi:GNAT family N-acetyltransferase [Actinocrispum sp. NPDC049592]|uniref:GNAT family N-acetyltransferase n=1 Tax=Actinocrispum sp. NPDC049592 TaxID=3154835 RepID=UPI0034302DAF
MIRTAGRDDLSLIGKLLGAAFQGDPVSAWIFPDDARRAAVQPKFFRTFAGLALDAGGIIYVHSDVAATVWFPGGDDDDDEASAQFDMLSEDEADRFGRLTEVMAENHPTMGRHLHLQFIGVHPDHQRAGIGGALLAHNLQALDERRMAAYLEASSTLSPPLYQRHGFEHIGTPFGPEPGPRMYPMWREPGQ